MRVLVIEDHVTLADRIAQGLRQAGMAVDVVHDGAAALDAATVCREAKALIRSIHMRGKKAGVVRMIVRTAAARPLAT